MSHIKNSLAFASFFAIILFSAPLLSMAHEEHAAAVDNPLPVMDSDGLGYDDVTIGHYKLDTHHASLIWRVNHWGISDFVGRFNNFEANLVIGSGGVEDIILNAAIDVSSLDVNNPSFADELIGDDWMNSVEFPVITYRSTDIEALSSDTAIVTGDLSFMGVTLPVEMEVTLTGAGENFAGVKTIGFSASATLDRAEFGLSRYAPNVGSLVEVQFDGEFNLISHDFER